MAYALSQSSEQEQCVIISGHSGSGKTEAAKAIVQYLTMLYQRSDSHRIRQYLGALMLSRVLYLFEHRDDTCLRDLIEVSGK
ncbi:myosin IE heavy chain-like [Cariama cristata]